MPETTNQYMFDSADDTQWVIVLPMCNLSGAGCVVQAAWCELGGAIDVVKGLWCTCAGRVGSVACKLCGMSYVVVKTTPSFLISVGGVSPPSPAPHRPPSRAATARRRHSDPRRGATTR
eukprot:9379914-Pyramimonas_sp.AAC.1